MPLGKELGFLPGEIGEKLRPWMEPVFDNLEFILKQHHHIHDTDEAADPRKGVNPKRSSVDAEILQQNMDQIMSKHHKGRNVDDGKEHRKGRQRKNKAYSVDGDIGDMLDSGVLEVQPLTYVRGRSLPGQFLIIDEAQNLTHHEVQNHRYPCWRGYQNRLDGRSVSDRQSLP